jgi:RHS repeat-associated protein
VGVENMTCDLEGHIKEWKPSGALVEDTHEYDGNGRRMRSKLDNAANWTHFIHDELTENLICEFTLVSGTFTIKALNTYGLGLISSNREGTIRYFHFDGLGSTAHLTDASQNITDSYTYNAFGVPYTPSGSSVNPYRYVGQWGYYDDGAMGSSSGMLLLGVRYYWPKYGRFTTWDPIPVSNNYLYGNSDPANAIDPYGLTPAYKYCKPQLIPGTGPGIDELDECCRKHDDCFDRHKCTMWNQAFYRDCWVCNINLCRCARKAKCKITVVRVGNNFMPSACETVRQAALAYACSFLSTANLLILERRGIPKCHGGKY